MDEKGQVYFDADGLKGEDAARFAEAEAALGEKLARREQSAEALTAAARDARVARTSGRVSGAEGKVPRDVEGK